MRQRVAANHSICLV